MPYSDDQLKQLAQEACQHPEGSIDRQKRLTQILAVVSPKLWKESTPQYADALQKTLLYFCKNICKTYDASKASIPTWLNAYLKWRLVDEKQQKGPPMLSIDTGGFSDDGDGAGIDIPAPDNEPSDAELLIAAIQEWASKDKTGELRSKHVRGKPAVNCQMLILRRLNPDEFTWERLSEEFDTPVPTLSTFYQRQCVPRLRKFAEESGYL